MVSVLAAATLRPDPAPAHRSGTDVRQILASLVHGLWLAVTSSPLAAIGFGASVLLVSVHVVHALMYPSSSRDPIRRFSRADKAYILARAGGRCEHHSLLFGRCRATESLEADHVHPHSRGGWTNVANGQALCRDHNRSKRATIPYNWQLHGIEKRRAAYFPPGSSAAVIRRQAAAGRKRAVPSD